MDMKHEWIDWMEKRSSIRTYEGTGLTNEQKVEVLSAIDGLKAPFDGKVRFGFVETEESGEMKLGTYGVIKGAKTFLVAAVTESNHDMETLGYLMEALIVKAAGMELGTCWLGGTFNRKDFGTALNLMTSEYIPAVSPIGTATSKRRMVDKVMRSLVGATKRKPWEELFYKEDFNCPLLESETGSYKKVLEMVRIAPSASNKQPWRIVRKNGDYHFYLMPTKNYPRQAQRMDLGIAMCHFELAACSLGLSGVFEVNEPAEFDSKEAVYIATWKPKTV